MNDHPPRTRTCDCPCHRGDEVFHIVDCCGSVLGRRPSRDLLVPPEAIRTQPQSDPSQRTDRVRL